MWQISRPAAAKRYVVAVVRGGGVFGWVGRTLACLLLVAERGGMRRVPVAGACPPAARWRAIGVVMRR